MGPVEQKASSGNAALIALIFTFSSFTSCLFTACGVPSVFTEAEKIEMVNLHNEERKLHGGNQLALVSTNIVTYSVHVSIDYETELYNRIRRIQEVVGLPKGWKGRDI